MFAAKRRHRITKVLLATAVMACTASAQAVIYISNFDPLGFSGVATFDVDPACLLVDGLNANDGITCTPDWLDATVTLDNLPGVDTFVFDYSAFLPSAVAVLAVDALGGELVGVHSTAIGPVLIAGNPVPEFNGLFSLRFDGTIVSLLDDGRLVAEAEAQFRRVSEPPAAALLPLALSLAGLLALGRVGRCRRLAPALR